VTAGVRSRPPRSGRRRGGPHDEDDLDPDRPDGVARIDFGAVRLPVPAGGVVEIGPRAKGRAQTVNVTLPQGRLSVSALAAPTTGRLWPALAEEINTALQDSGARVRSFHGPWGRELWARTGDALSVFVGIDGPRWMLYGVATAPAEDTGSLDRELRRVLDRTVVVRGRSPYPIRTVLPLVLPDDLQAEQDARREREAAAAAALEAEAAAAGNAADEVGEVGDGVAPGVVVPSDDPPTAEIPAVAPPVPAGQPRAAASEPALAFLLGDPMGRYAATRPGRHRRGA